jgi:putative ABC transport system substrate-binding protein
MKAISKYFVVICVLIVFLSGCAGKTQEEKVYHAGILSGINYFSDVPDGFREKMTELGYVEGENILYDLHYSDFDMAVYREILRKFIDDKVDLIFTFPTEVAQEAKSMASGTGIPIVFVAANVEEAGLIDSVREPGGDITGVRWTGSEIALFRFETLHNLVPQAKRFLVPYQRGIAIIPSQLEAISLAADEIGIEILEVPADNPQELEENMQAITTDDKDAVLFILDPLTPSPEGYAILNNFASKRGIPIGGTLFTSEDYEYDTLFGINPNNVEMGEQAAVLADKILRGTPAGTIPVVSAEARLTINYNAIQKMGLNISEGLLARADKIIH